MPIFANISYLTVMRLHNEGFELKKFKKDDIILF